MVVPLSVQRTGEGALQVDRCGIGRLADLAEQRDPFFLRCVIRIAPHRGLAEGREVEPFALGTVRHRGEQRQVADADDDFGGGGVVSQLSHDVALQHGWLLQLTRCSAAPASVMPSIRAADTSRAMYCAWARCMT